MVELINLTDRLLKAIPNAKHPKQVFDASVRGFHYWPSSTGAKGVGTFYLKFSADGRQRKMKIGRYPEMPLSEARKKALGVLGDVAKGDCPGDGYSAPCGAAGGGGGYVRSRLRQVHRTVLQTQTEDMAGNRAHVEPSRDADARQATGAG